MLASDPAYPAVNLWQTMLCYALNPACHYDLQTEDALMMPVYVEVCRDRLEERLNPFAVYLGGLDE